MVLSKSSLLILVFSIVSDFLNSPQEILTFIPLCGRLLTMKLSEWAKRKSGRKLHADVNGSLNLRERFLEGWGRLCRGKEQALRRQMQKFLRNLLSERYRRLWSKARGLLARNPYFAGVLSDSPKPEAWTSVHFRDVCPR